MSSGLETSLQLVVFIDSGPAFDPLVPCTASSLTYYAHVLLPKDAHIEPVLMRLERSTGESLLLIFGSDLSTACCEAVFGSETSVKCADRQVQRLPAWSNWVDLALQIQFRPANMI